MVGMGLHNIATKKAVSSVSVAEGDMKIRLDDEGRGNGEDAAKWSAPGIPLVDINEVQMGTPNMDTGIGITENLQRVLGLEDKRKSSQILQLHVIIMIVVVALVLLLVAKYTRFWETTPIAPKGAESANQINI